MNLDEKLVHGEKLSLASFKETRRRFENCDFNELAHGKKLSLASFEETRRRFENCDFNGGNQRSSDSYGAHSQPPTSSYQRNDEYDYPNIQKESPRDRRIVLVGMTGSGKSSSGNSIVGRKVFKATPSGSSETAYCEHVTAMVQGRNIRVVDTPGLFDTRQTNDETIREMTRCVALSAPGPHVLIMVVEGGRRASAQTQKCAEMILEVFGDQAIRHMIILFTRLEDLTYDGYTLDYFVQSLPPEMKQVLHKCGNRYVAFENREKSAEKKAAQVNELLALIDRVVDVNGGRCFTNDVYKDFEKMMLKREEKIKEEYDKEREKEFNEFKKRFKKDIERTLQIKKAQEKELKLKHDQAEQERKRLETQLNEERKHRENNTREQQTKEQLEIQKEIQRRLEIVIANEQAQERRHKQAMEKVKNLEKQMKKNLEVKEKELEDEYDKKKEKVRDVVLKVVQNDSAGTGDLFNLGMSLVAKGAGYVGDGLHYAGEAVRAVGAGVAIAAVGVKTSASALPAKVLSFIFGKK